MMNALKLADNIVRLRRQRKITQEELADFLGVTKAAVSKWENQQSTPDILLLPQLASFFGVTIDELIGYEAQLSQEQIRRVYIELTRKFAEQPFHEVMEQVRSYIHQYYSCYPFLLQLCVLYLNHFMLAETEEEQKKILKEADGLCDRILNQCSDMRVRGDALALKALMNLQLGKSAETIEMLESITDPGRIAEQNEAVLIQAYQMAGEQEKAKSYTQIRQYLHLLSLIGMSIQLLVLYEAEPERCEETIQRTKGIIELYRVDLLHPNLAAQFYYQTAIVYARNGEKKHALKELESFGKCVCELLKSDHLVLHGDSYFDRLDEWISSLPLGEMAPRDLAFARKNALQGLSHPVFKLIKDTAEFRNIYHQISGGL